MLQNFESAIAFLEKFSSFQERMNLDSWRNFSLENLKLVADKFCAGWGNLKVVSVAGSKGKGSVAFEIARNLNRALPGPTGVFISPYVFNPREMILVGGRVITEGDFVFLVEELRKFIESESLSEKFAIAIGKLTRFEVFLLLALKFFLLIRAKWVILEFGLGGRRDAVNLLEPDILVLCLMELEHLDFLGNSLRGIIAEELSVLRGKTKLFVMKQNSKVLRMITEEYLKIAKREITFFENKDLVDGLEVAKIKGNKALADLVSRQILLEEGVGCVNFGPHFENEGALPARLQILKIDGRALLLDMAHTPKSFQRLVDFFQKNFKGKKPVLLFSLMSDKDLVKISGVIVDFCKKNGGRLVVTELPLKRAFSLKEMKEIFLRAVVQDLDLKFQKKPLQAWDFIFSSLKEDEVPIICGSSYLPRFLSVRLSEHFSLLSAESFFS